MSRAQGLINKVNSVLTRFAPPQRTAYKRTIVHTGNEQIGRDTQTVTDVLLSPQPYFHRIGREHVPGGHARAETLVDGSGSALLADDYQFLISPTAMSLADLENPDVQIVLKDSSGNTEVLRFLDQEPAQMQDTDILYTAYMRSVKRP